MISLSLPASWQPLLQDEMQQDYFKKLDRFVQNEYAQNNCFPPADLIFSAFDYCSFEQTKVVILGQDPYHGFGQAHGLAFSVNDGVKIPPSLVNIFKEIETDLDQPIPITGNLERWAQQGVLLLNTTLTVREHQAGSHQKQGWEQFTDAVIKQLSVQREDLVFMLWGGYAKKKAKLIDSEKHLILESGHPSPLSANRGHWFGNKHFSRANTYLKAHGKSEINW